MRSSYLKEMGISEWVPRESAPVESLPVALEADPSIFWHFVGQTPQGDSAMLFENIIRSLRLKKNQWAWATLAELKNNPIDTKLTFKIIQNEAKKVKLNLETTKYHKFENSNGYGVLFHSKEQLLNPNNGIYNRKNDSILIEAIIKILN
jgi:DNA polymerase III psi subunit